MSQPTTKPNDRHKNGFCLSSFIIIFVAFDTFYVVLYILGFRHEKGFSMHDIRFNIDMQEKYFKYILLLMLFCRPIRKIEFGVALIINIYLRTLITILVSAENRKV